MQSLVPALLATVLCSVTGLFTGPNKMDAAVVPVRPQQIEFNVGPLDAPMAARTAVLMMPGETKIHAIISIFYIGGRPEIYVNLDSTWLDGDGALIDALSTRELFDIIAMAAVSKAIAQGTTNCPVNCGVTGETVRVIIPSCVKRIGSGSGTMFADCNPGTQCVREFIVCCANSLGVPLIQEINPGGSGGGCGANSEGCEPTCN